MYLITGATGRLGQHVVAQVLARVGAEQVAVCVRQPSEELLALGVSVRQADYEDPASLLAALTGIDRVLLISSSGKPHELRFQHHLNVLEAAVKAGVEHIVYTSLFETSPDSIGAVHRRTEDAIRAANIKHTFLRHPLYTENILTGVLEDPELISATAGERMATATRGDLAEVAAVVLTGAGHEGSSYALNGPPWTYDELAAQLSTHTGRPFTHKSVGPEEFGRLLTEEGVDEPLHGILSDIHATIAAGKLSTESPHLAALLGREPTSMQAAVSALSA